MVAHHPQDHPEVDTEDPLPVPTVHHRQLLVDTEEASHPPLVRADPHLVLILSSGTGSPLLTPTDLVILLPLSSRGL